MAEHSLRDKRDVKPLTACILWPGEVASLQLSRFLD